MESTTKLLLVLPALALILFSSHAFSNSLSGTENSHEALNSNVPSASNIEEIDVVKILEDGAYRHGAFVLTPRLYEDHVRIYVSSDTKRQHAVYKFPFSTLQGSYIRIADSSGTMKTLRIDYDAKELSRFIDEENKKSENYIIQFKDAPVLVKKTELEKELQTLDKSRSEKEIALSNMQEKASGKYAVSASTLAAIESEIFSLEQKQQKLKKDMPKTLEAHSKQIQKTHKTAKQEITAIADKKNSDVKFSKEFKELFNGIAMSASAQSIKEIEKRPYVEKIHLDREVHATLDVSVPLINATSLWNVLDESGRNITGQNITIAIIDTGVDYTHADLGNCTGMGVSHLPREPVLDNVTESPHPYTNNYDNTWIITQSGFSHISVHFVNISTENYYDSVYIMNATDDIVASYSGTFTDFWTPAIEGNLIKIRLMSDYSVTDYGFYIDKVANGTYASNISCGKVIGGYDFSNDDADPMDDHGHGTHVAATAAGNGSLKGVAPDAKILAYKVLNAYGSGSMSDVIAGIERAVNDSADIISLSLGSSGNPDDPTSVAVDNAVDAGVVVVVAAGNSGPYAQTIMSPGTARNAITVGATDDSDIIADFSSRGPVVWGNSSIIKPDVVAPGVEICAAQYGSAWSDSLCIDNEHVSISGTSMATPHVAGLSALMLQAYPGWSPADVKSAIMGSAIDLGYDMATQGAGRVDALGFYNVSIQTYPQTISINFAEGAYAIASEILRIKNLRNYTIEINLTAGLANNTAGNEFNISSLNTSFATIPANSEITVNFTVNLTVNKGTLFGKITILTEGKNYTVPYQAMQLVRVNISTTSDAEYPDFYIHDDDFSERLEAYYGIEYTGNNYSFIVDSNKNYTFYAVSSFDEPSLEYIISNRTYVSGDGASIVLNLSDARPFNVVAESFSGRQLKLYEWQKGFLSYNSNGDIFGVNYFSGYEYGNRTVYLSNKPEGSVDTDIVLKYYGVPVRQ